MDKDEILKNLKTLLEQKQKKLEGLENYWSGSFREPGITAQKAMEFVRGEEEGILAAMRLITSLPDADEPEFPDPENPYHLTGKNLDEAIEARRKY
jgi:hypothetical protein